MGTRLPFDLIDSGEETPVYAIRDLNGDGIAKESEIKVVDMLRTPMVWPSTRARFMWRR